MDDRWKSWVKGNIERGCNPNDLRKILLENKFTHAEIEAELALAGGNGAAPINYEALAASHVAKHHQAKPVDTAGKAQIFMLEGFMTPQECGELIAVSKEQLTPSTISTQETEPDKYFRTSSTCYLSRLDAPIVATIDQRIADTLGIHVAYSEGIQIQRYEVGQEFKPHTDYFQPGTKEYQKYCSVQGNRTWTLMVYLNDVAKGGGTKFTELDMTFMPKIGTALAWNNLLPSGKPNPNTKHWGQPVEEGYKVIITKWFREIAIGEGKEQPMLMGV